MNRAAGQSARALHGPAFGEGVVDHRTARLGDVRAARRQFHVESEAQVLSLARHFPQRVVSFRPGLAQFEIGGTHLVREHAGRERDEQNQDEERAFHFASCLRSVCLHRLRVLDGHRVTLEQLLVELLVRFQPPGVVPLTAHGVAHVRQRGQAAFRAFADEHQMHAEAGLDRPLPLAGRKSAQLRRELFAELFRNLAGRQRRRSCDPAGTDRPAPRHRPCRRPGSTARAVARRRAQGFRRASPG